ncbi:MAG: serine/threonine-protein kinase [Lachnospiraceae bacterium]|nr:serine/threonine-protein kinase [Lachnospiraceae bacterium]
MKSEEGHRELQEGVRQLETGTKLGKYRILRQLGKGGEGSVYLAVHEQTEQLWAVKEIARANRQADAYHEMQMMKRFDHPSLPKVVDVLENDCSVFLVMEYIRGHSLQKDLEGSQHFTERQTLEVGLQIAGALEYLHTRTHPVLHLDLKPANIIRTKEGRLVLTDFGSAAGVHRQEDLIRKGTVGYAAPEQYDSARKLDARTDVYGLGAVLYRAVSGMTYSVQMCKSKVPGCPDRLGQIIKNCLQEEPSRRYQSAGAVRQALLEYKRGQRREQRRKQMWLALLLAIFAGAAAGRAVNEELHTETGQALDYTRMVAEAQVSPTEKARELLRQAIYLEPSRGQAWQILMDTCLTDGIFDTAEERELREILHTIPLGGADTQEELLASSGDDYILTALQIGLAYRYGWEDPEEGRRMAEGWFRKVVEMAEAMEDDSSADNRRVYLEEGQTGRGAGEDESSSDAMEEKIERIESSADGENGQIHQACQIAGLFVKLGSLEKSTAAGGMDVMTADQPEVLYWEQLQAMLDELEGGELSVSSWIRQSFCEESIDQLTACCHVLSREGVPVQEIEACAQRLQDLATNGMPGGEECVGDLRSESEDHPSGETEEVEIRRQETRGDPSGEQLQKKMVVLRQLLDNLK